MFEITINGRTEKFESSEEMEKFRQRMQSRYGFRKSKKQKNPKVSHGLFSRLAAKEKDKA